MGMTASLTFTHGPLFPNLVWGRGGAALVIMGLKWAAAENRGRGG